MAGRKAKQWMTTHLQFCLGPHSPVALLPVSCPADEPVASLSITASFRLRNIPSCAFSHPFVFHTAHPRRMAKHEQLRGHDSPHGGSRVPARTISRSFPSVCLVAALAPTYPALIDLFRGTISTTCTPAKGGEADQTRAWSAKYKVQSTYEIRHTKYAVQSTFCADAVKLCTAY